LDHYTKKAALTRATTGDYTYGLFLSDIGAWFLWLPKFEQAKDFMVVVMFYRLRATIKSHRRSSMQIYFKVN
jgi:hypothetical protein